MDPLVELALDNSSDPDGTLRQVQFWVAGIAGLFPSELELQVEGT